MTETTRPRIEIVRWGLCAVLGLTACAGPRVEVQTEFASLDADLVEARLARGALGQHEGGAAKLREAAQLALALGNHDEAVDFAREQLELARVELAIATLDGAPEAELDAAYADLDVAATLAVEIGDQVPSARLVVEAAQFLAKPKRAKKALERALREAHRADLSWGYERLWSAFAHDEDMLASLERLRWRSVRSPGMPAGASTLPSRSLAKVGSHVVDLLWSRADLASESLDEADFRANIEAILDADAWEVQALSAKVVLDARERGEFEGDETLLPDLSLYGGVPLGVLARMLERRRQAPDNLALGLGLAQIMIREGTPGDAATILAGLEPKPGTRHERALYAQLSAMSQLESGTPEGLASFERWYRKAHAKRSTSVSSWLVGFAGDDGPEPVHALARQAGEGLANRAKGAGVPRLGDDALWSLATDTEISDGVRARSMATLTSRDGAAGAGLAICVERELAGTDCEELRDELAALDAWDDEYAAGLEALAASANTRTRWLRNFSHLEPAQMVALRGELLAFEGTRIVATTDYQRAAILADLASGEVEAARARLSRFAALLDPPLRVFAQLVLADLDEGQIAAEQLPDSFVIASDLEAEAERLDSPWGSGELTSETIEFVREWYPGDGRQARLTQGLALGRMGAYDAASDVLGDLLDQLDGEASAFVAARLALVAELAGAPERLARAIAVLEAKDPGGLALPLVRARAAARAGDREGAHQAWLEALARRPRSRALFESTLQTLPEDQATLSRVRGALLAFPSSRVHAEAEHLLDAAARDELDGRLFRELWLKRHDPAELLELGAPAAALADLGQRGFDELHGRLRAATSLDEARPIATQLGAWLEAMPAKARAEHLGFEVWLRYLLDQRDELVALSEACPLHNGYRDRPLATHPALSLSAARARGQVDDALHWAVVRQVMFSDGDPELIAHLQATHSDPDLARYACTYLYDRDEAAIALPACVDAWAHGPSPVIAYRLAELAYNHGEELEAHGLEPAQFIRVAAKLPGAAREPWWLYFESIWMSRQGDHEDGARLRLQQLALEPVVAHAGHVELGQLGDRSRGALMRQQFVSRYGREDQRGQALAALAAMRGLELDAAEYYARRILAWLPTEAESGGVESSEAQSSEAQFSAPAAWMFNASRNDETNAAELRSLALLIPAVCELARDELGEGRISTEDLAELLRAYGEGRGDAVVELAEAHPRSRMAKLMVMLGHVQDKRREPALALARELVDSGASNPWVLLEALPLLSRAEELDRARAALTRARAEHVEHLWLSDAVMPTKLTGASDGLPDWIRSPEALDQMLTSIDQAQLESLEPRRHADIDSFAEVFFPGGVELDDDGLGWTAPIETETETDAEASGPRRSQWIAREHRAGRCEAKDCGEEWIEAWINEGYELLWSRELELHGGPAFEFVISRRDQVVHSVLVPTGGSVFTLMTRTAPDDLGALAPTLKLARDSFRPLDWSVSATVAEGLRAVDRPASPSLRLHGRRALAALDPSTTEGCGLEPDMLSGLESELRGGLLLDLFLSARDPWQRRAIVACTSSDAAEAAPLALASLLDDDPVVHAFGRAATRHHPERVRNDARRVLYAAPEVAISNPEMSRRSDLAPHGLLELIATLPEAHAQALTAELLGQGPRLRAIALAANAAIDYPDGPSESGEFAGHIERGRLHEVVRAGEPQEALLAAASLNAFLDADTIASLRERADALARTSIEDEIGRALAGELASTLAAALSRKDRKRLRALLEAVELEPKDGEAEAAKATRRELEDLLEGHADGIALAAKADAPLGASWAASVARAQREREPARSREALAELSLAELSPGDDWTFVRVSSAGLFASSFESLMRRLSTGESNSALLVRQLLTSLMVEGPFSLLREPQAIDASAPIECVTQIADPDSYVCTAQIIDREVVLAQLGQRESDMSSGLVFPMQVAVAGMVGVPFMAAAPALVHALIAESNEEGSVADTPRIARERLRQVVNVADHELELYANVTIEEDAVVIDAEFYLFVEDRLFVFSDFDLVEQFLREHPAGVDSLAASPAFSASRARWSEGMALQSFVSLDELDMSVELAFDTSGLAFSAELAGDVGGHGDLGVLAQLLPEDAVSVAGVALEAELLEDLFDDPVFERCAGFAGDASSASKDDAGEVGSGEAGSGSGRTEACGLAPSDRMPPFELIEAGVPTVFAWYPEPGHSLWQDWVLVVADQPELRRAMKRVGLSKPAKGEVSMQGGVWLQARDGAVLVSSTQALAETARARPRPSPSEDASYALFHFDGERVAAVIEGFGAHYVGEELDLRLLAASTFFGLIEGAELRAESHKDQSSSLSAKLSLELAETETELALIDQWLANPEIANASMLPRELRRSERDAGLVYRIQVADAEDFAARTIPSDNPRMLVEVVAADELRLTVLPSAMVPAPAEAQTLDAATRERMLGATDDFLIEEPEIIELAKRLAVAGDPEASVAAILGWVHDHIEYQLVPNSPDVLTLLEQGRGDCSEYALLTVTLLRAAGVPARLEEGMAAGGMTLGAHAWVGWHDGARWREIDPTWGTTSVSSGHLRTEIFDVLAAISLGQFAVVAIDPL